MVLKITMNTKHKNFELDREKILLEIDNQIETARLKGVEFEQVNLPIDVYIFLDNWAKENIVKYNEMGYKRKIYGYPCNWY